VSARVKQGTGDIPREMGAYTRGSGGTQDLQELLEDLAYTLLTLFWSETN